MSVSVNIYLWVAVGIVISVILPIIWAAVYRYFPKPAPAGGTAAVAPAMLDFWRIVAPYVLLGVASLLTAILIVAFLGDKLTDFKAAILAGYAWDSTLQKLRG
jgi:hypothetical protein